MGYIINLIAKAFLFSKNPKAFKKKINNPIDKDRLKLKLIK